MYVEAPRKLGSSGVSSLVIITTSHAPHLPL
eukprot:COSAG05_NODE_6839_length_893_cov_2.607053_2_plen_30_part_01